MVAINIDEWGLVRSEQEEIEESYFVSMTDIMVGLLFIFVIMLMAFGLMLKDAEDSTKETHAELKKAQTEMKEVVSTTKQEIEEVQKIDSVRARMLRTIETRLQQVGVYVTVQEENVYSVCQTRFCLRRTSTHCRSGELLPSDILLVHLTISCRVTPSLRHRLIHETADWTSPTPFTWRPSSSKGTPTRTVLRNTTGSYRRGGRSTHSSS